PCGGDFLKWWTVWESNPRPPECDSGALPTELTALSWHASAKLLYESVEFNRMSSELFNMLFLFVKDVSQNHSYRVIRACWHAFLIHPNSLFFNGKDSPQLSSRRNLSIISFFSFSLLYPRDYILVIQLHSFYLVS